jgi:hypothetical protein
MATRLASINIEWTDEQKKLIGQLSKEITGAVIGVRTSLDKIPNEYGGAEANEADKQLVNILYETNADFVGRVGGAVGLAQDPSFEGLLALALAW